MCRILSTLIAASLFLATALAADNAKDSKDSKDNKDNKTATKPGDKSDSPAVAKARKKLEENKVDPKDCEFKDEPLESVLKKLLTEGAELSFYFDNSVARHKPITFTLKQEKSLKDVLDELFKKYDIGYIIHRKDKDADRYDGWLLVKSGNERGDEGSKDAKKDAKPAKPGASGEKPAAGDKSAKPPAENTTTDEDRAAAKLKNAKRFLDMNLKGDAKEYCEEILKKYPKTKAAEEAKEMLEKLK